MLGKSPLATTALATTLQTEVIVSLEATLAAISSVAASLSVTRGFSTTISSVSIITLDVDVDELYPIVPDQEASSTTVTVAGKSSTTITPAGKSSTTVDCPASSSTTVYQ